MLEALFLEIVKKLQGWDSTQIYSFLNKTRTCEGSDQIRVVISSLTVKCKCSLCVSGLSKVVHTGLLNFLDR